MKHTYKIEGLSSELLATIIAQMVQFSRNDYCLDCFSSPHYPSDVAWNVSYICACFLAQNTVHGEDGVETEFPFNCLKIEEDVSYEERLVLARAAVALWNSNL